MLTEMECFPSGVYFDLVNPSGNKMHLRDIAWHLSNECRFCGACRRHYSVAEHLIRCARLAKSLGYSRDAQRAVFAHDFAEAYCKDIHNPLKQAIRGVVPTYDHLESIVSKVVEGRFSVDFATYLKGVKTVDIVLLYVEAQHLLKNKGSGWACFEYPFWYDNAAAMNMAFSQWRKLPVFPNGIRKLFLKTARLLGFE